MMIHWTVVTKSRGLIVNVKKRSETARPETFKGVQKVLQVVYVPGPETHVNLSCVRSGNFDERTYTMKYEKLF